MFQAKTKNLKNFSTSAERFEGANLLCPGCAHSIIVREVLNATDDNLILAASTGCLEVCTAVYPHTSWDASWIHIGFENGSSAVAGAEAMYKALKNKGRLKQPDRTPKFVAFGGDGATYDIGFQWISGCFERGHDMMYVCLDNEVYANTGGQRSSSTPIGASATTTPAGRISYGEKQNKKDMMAIMAAHGAPYVAQVAPNKWKDMVAKIQKGFATEGPVFINAMSACTTEWKFAPASSLKRAPTVPFGLDRSSVAIALHPLSASAICSSGKGRKTRIPTTPALIPWARSSFETSTAVSTDVPIQTIAISASSIL